MNKISHKLFVTSDHHFAHKNIIQYCHRPFESIEQMNELLIFYWNEVVSPTDTVIHCGDFIMGGKESFGIILPRLNGTILLVRGNHDYNVKFYERFAPKISILPHKYEMELGGFPPFTRLIFSHKPLPSREIPYDAINIHGHIHSHRSPLFMPFDRRLDVGVDNWGFKPQKLGDIIHKLPRLEDK